MEYPRRLSDNPSMPPSSSTPGLVVRGVTPPLALQDFRLIAFDMDSTLINIECVDEIADAAGRKAEVAAITEAAMRGEITDYKDSLRRRVALLAGVPVRRCNTSTTSGCNSTRAPKRWCAPPGARPEDAARLRRLHLLHRPHPRPARDRLHAQQRARDRRRPAHRPHGRPALGRHLRRRREAPHAARDLRRARHRAASRPSPSATAPTTCR